MPPSSAVSSPKTSAESLGLIRNRFLERLHPPAGLLTARTEPVADVIIIQHANQILPRFIGMRIGLVNRRCECLFGNQHFRPVRPPDDQSLRFNITALEQARLSFSQLADRQCIAGKGDRERIELMSTSLLGHGFRVNSS